MKKFAIIICFFISFSVAGQTLKVMTYNIRFATEQDGVNAWSKRKNKVFDLLRKYDPDIIGVQEALHSQIEDIIAALPEYTYTGVGRDDGKTKGEYSAILYKKKKLKLLQGSTFWLSETPEIPGSKNWDAAITRVATWGTFQHTKSKKNFLLINTHFDHIGQEARRQSALLLKQKGSQLRNGLPVVIMGDFNCTRDEAPYAAMMDAGTLAVTDPAPKNAPGTFCSFEVNSIPCKPIDYIFHTSEWNAFDYQVIQDNDGKHYPSDHLPVMITVTPRK